MGVRIDRVYTRSGDRGETALVGGVRVPKDSPRIEAFGCFDELNAHLGAALCELRHAAEPDANLKALDEHLEWTQQKLFDLGAYLATPAGKSAGGTPSAGPGDVERLEQAMDLWEEGLEPLKSFILPGGGRIGAALHVCRTVCRRAEIATLRVHRTEPLDPVVLQFLNRLSDFLFVAARIVARQLREPETLWKPAAPAKSRHRAD